jgi:hypothetical protein
MVQVAPHHLGFVKGVDVYHCKLEQHAQEEGCNLDCTPLYVACYI